MSLRPSLFPALTARLGHYCPNGEVASGEGKEVARRKGFEVVRGNGSDGVRTHLWVTSLFRGVDVWSSDTWSRIGGNASRRGQSHVNTRHKVLVWY
jgi:hypothetical protein